MTNNTEKFFSNLFTRERRKKVEKEIEKRMGSRTRCQQEQIVTKKSRVQGCETIGFESNSNWTVTKRINSEKVEPKKSGAGFLRGKSGTVRVDFKLFQPENAPRHWR